MHEERHEQLAGTANCSKNRTDSRGNTAIAALLLVVGVGVAAITFDTMHPRNTSQVAATAVTTPTTPTEKKDESKAITKECKVGYDYVVRLNKDKGVTVSPVDPRDEKLTSLEEPKGNQCIAPDGKPVTQVTDTESTAMRSCAPPPNGWKSHVFFCTEITAKKDEKESCKRLPDCTPGEGFDTDYYKKEQIPSILAQELKDAKPEERGDLAKGIQKYGDQELSKGVFDAFDEDRRTAKSELDEANAALEKAKAAREAAGCSPGIPGGGDGTAYLIILTQCGQLRKDEYEAENNAKAKDDYYKSLAENAKGLDDVKKALDPSAAGCTGERCIKGPDGKLAPDDRFKPPQSTIPTPPPGGCTGANCGGGGGGGTQSNGSSGFNPSSLMGPLAGILAGLAQGALQPQPSCTIQASPKNISQPGQPVTLSWQAQNAQSAYISNLGQVGPSGSTQVQVQQTTTYTMQVQGYPPQQQQQQYNPYGQQPQLVFNPYTGQYQYVQPQQQANPYAQLGQTIGQLVNGTGGQQQASCSTQVTVGGDGGGVKAQLSCQPKVADVGMQVALSYACQNATGFETDGFETDGQLSGSASIAVRAPEAGSNKITYGLKCTNQGASDSAECSVNVSRASIVLVANPKNVRSGETSNIGWITGGMDKCVISSPTLAQFTQENASNTSTSGAAKTPPLTQNATFVLTCTTLGGATKSAETTVEI